MGHSHFTGCRIDCAKKRNSYFTILRPAKTSYINVSKGVDHLASNAVTASEKNSDAQTVNYVNTVGIPHVVCSNIKSTLLSYRPLVTNVKMRNSRRASLVPTVEIDA